MTADGPAAQELGGARAPESAGCSFGILAGILAVLGLIASLLFLGQPPRAPEVILGEAFRWEALPFELELEGAGRNRDGAELVRLAHPDFRDGIPEPEAPEPAEREGEDSDELTAAAIATESDPGVDSADPASDVDAKASDANVRVEVGADSNRYATVEPVATDSPPVEVLFAFYPEAGPVAALFRGQSRFGFGGGMERMGDEGDGPKTVHREVRRDILTWREYQANYVLERLYLADRHFRDSLRVNLSREGVYCVLFAQWPLDHKASAERVEELLEAFEPVASQSEGEDA